MFIMYLDISLHYHEYCKYNIAIDWYYDIIMTMKQPNSKSLSTYKIREILFFCHDVNAAQNSKLPVINRNTINKYYTIFKH